MKSYDYVSLLGRSAASGIVLSFFENHNVQWKSLPVYKSLGQTWAKLSLYDALLVMEFEKDTKPHSSVLHKPRDFKVRKITLSNHSKENHQYIGNFQGPLNLKSNLKDFIRTLGENYQKDHLKGTYLWSDDKGTIELYVDPTSQQVDYINFIVKDIDAPNVQRAGTVSQKDAETLGVEGLGVEQLGIEPPDIQYQDTPEPSEFDNVSAVERESNSIFGLIVFVIALGFGLYYYDEIIAFLT